MDGLVRKLGLVIVASAICCLFSPRTAEAITVRPVKNVHQAKESVRKTPKPPRDNQVHSGGVEGSITLVTFISSRRQHHNEPVLERGVGESAAQVRASAEQARPRPPSTTALLSVESLPPHWGSTHLSI